jgi:fructose/tagatose bisphosphate aldolase
MIDGSHLSFEENIALTRKVVEAMKEVVKDKMCPFGNFGKT